jgi:Methyltransferase domain
VPFSTRSGCDAIRKSHLQRLARACIEAGISKFIDQCSIAVVRLNSRVHRCFTTIFGDHPTVLRRRSSPAGQLIFVCNICGARACADLLQILDRGSQTCSKCNSSNRFRSLIAALQERLFDEVSPLKNWRVRKDIAGLGMSDSPVYSVGPAKKFNYMNTFFHTEPFLDISSPDAQFHDRFDFVISAEVLEHVRPPIDMAFKGLRLLLKPRGLLVLTVPFGQQADTIEHFPDLYRFEIIGVGSERELINFTPKGEKQIYRNLVFHGGKGATLEMRVFSESALLKLLKDSGFHEIQIHNRWLPQWGIVHSHPFSLPITAIAL